MKIFYQIVFTCCLSVHLQAQVRLPRLVSNGMVLQRDTPLRIWGWASPGEKITVVFSGDSEKHETTANSKGEWQTWLPKQKAGGPYTMKIEGKDTHTIENILIGDVWLCSGQSNMEQGMGVRLKYKYAEEIATVNNPFIRQFLVPDRYDYHAPWQDFKTGSWKEANPGNIRDFSAVGYFFAKELYAKYKIPVGLLNAAWGGSPAEAWISEDALKKFPPYYERMQKFRNDQWVNELGAAEQRKVKEWLSALDSNDTGNKSGWKDPLHSDEEWRVINIPGKWNTTATGFSRGVIWFRKKITVPPGIAGKPGKIELGRITDTDSVFINGKFVGNTTYQYPARRYEFNNTVLQPGENLIVIRATSHGGNGEFARGKRYELVAGGDTINLEGQWKYNIGYATDIPFPPGTSIHFQPGGLYNAMIAPLVNYPIKGALWYQGETNSNYPGNYHSLMQALVSDWRSHWKNRFPFIYVQLPNFMEARPIPQLNSKWAELRQQQLQALSIPSTGMVTAIDLGEWNDLHPENKKDISHRLFLWAEKLAYGNKKIVPSGPVVRSAKVKGNRIILSFDYAGSGLISSDGKPLRHFAIAGKDGNHFPAFAQIKKNTVEVWSEEVAKPVSVYYAWADNPEFVNFYNKEGLPASPFKKVVGKNDQTPQ